MAECIVKVPRDTAADYDYIAFSFNGYHSYEDLKILRVSESNRYNENIAPKINAKTEKASGTEGNYLFEITHKRKTFSINIAFDDLYEEDYQKLKQVFRPDIIGELWFAEYPFKVYDAKLAAPLTLNVIPFDASDGSGRRLYKGTGTIEMFAPYPYAHTPDKVVCWDEEQEIYVERGDGKDFASYQDFNNRNQWKSIFEMHGEVPSYFQIKIGTKENSQLKYGLSEDGTYAVCLGPRDYDANPFVYWDSEAETWQTDNDITKINTHDWKLRIPDTVFLYGKELEVKEIADYAFLENSNKFITRIKQNVDIYLPSTVEKIGYRSFYFWYHGKILFEGECNVKYFERKSVYEITRLSLFEDEFKTKWYYFGPSNNKRLIGVHFSRGIEDAIIRLPAQVSVIGKYVFSLSNKEIDVVDLYNGNDELYFNLPIFDSSFLKQFQNGTLRLPFIGRSEQEATPLANFFDGDEYSIKTLYVHSGQIVPQCFQDVNFSKEPGILLRKNNFNIITKEAFKNTKFTNVGTFEEYDEGNALYVSKIESGAFIGSQVSELTLKPIDETEKTIIIETEAFVDCQQLQSFSLDGFNKISAIRAFGDKNYIKELTTNYPKESWTKLKDMMGQPNKQQILTLVGSIPDSFVENYGVHSVNIKNCETIGTRAFCGCRWLCNLFLFNGGINFNEFAFKGCSNLEGINIIELEDWLSNNFSGPESNPMYDAWDSSLKIGEARLAITDQLKQEVITANTFVNYDFTDEVDLSGTTVYSNAFYQCQFKKTLSFVFSNKTCLEPTPFKENIFYGGIVITIKNCEIIQSALNLSKVQGDLSIHLEEIEITKNSPLKEQEKYDQLSINYLFGSYPFFNSQASIKLYLADDQYIPPIFFSNINQGSAFNIQTTIYYSTQSALFLLGKHYYNLFKNSQIFQFQIKKRSGKNPGEYIEQQTTIETNNFVCPYQGGYKTLIYKRNYQIASGWLGQNKELIFCLENIITPNNGNWDILNCKEFYMKNSQRLDLTTRRQKFLFIRGTLLETANFVAPNSSNFFLGNIEGQEFTSIDNNEMQEAFQRRISSQGATYNIRKLSRHYDIYGGQD